MGDFGITLIVPPILHSPTTGLSQSITGHLNFAIGFMPLQGNITGDYNTAIGGFVQHEINLGRLPKDCPGCGSPVESVKCKYCDRIHIG